MTDLEEKISPFKWVNCEESNSVILDAGAYQDFIFLSRADEGFEGSGYDWASFADVFLRENLPHLTEVIHFDPEASMFCAYSEDKEALKTFILAFKNLCEDKEKALDIFSRAVLD